MASARWKAKAKELRVAMAELDLNQRQVADKAELSRALVSGVLNGRVVQQRTARDIAAAVGKPLEAIFEQVDPAQAEAA